MKLLGAILICLLSCAAAPAADDLARRAWEMERGGDATGARDLLQRAAQEGNNAAVARAYAEFLDRHRDLGARAAYEKLLANGDLSPQDRAVIARRLTTLDLLAGDRDAAERHLAEYSKSAGTNLSLSSTSAATTEVSVIEIPGPLRSFARMAALSPDLPPEDLLPALARNVVTNGYQAVSSNEGLEQTEYLKLVVRYLSQARELDKMAGKDKVIKIDTCETATTGDLLKVLGYRMRGGCGSDVVLETVNATRAFLTIDSGFPLADLEQALRSNRPFTYSYTPSRVPVLYGADYWVSSSQKGAGEFIDLFLSDPTMCRLYLGFSKMDPAVSHALRESSTAPRLKAFAHVLDFYGGMFEVRNGKAVVPGGERSERFWTESVGAPLDKPGPFFEKLAARDDGWLASYYDALLRVNGPSITYLTDPDRMKRFYGAIRGKVTSPGPARPVFRANTDMMLLTSRLHVGPDGKPLIPGGLEVWKDLFIHHPHGKYDGKLTKAATGWKERDDLMEALFALCRKTVENEPLKMFMALSDLESRRQKPLETATVARLLRDYHQYGPQYSMLAESAELDDKTLIRYLDTAQSLTGIKDQLSRADVVGTFQALTSMWQILVRQGSVSPGAADALLVEIIKPFENINSSRDLFDAGRSGVRAMLAASNTPKDLSVQDAVLDLLAGAVKSPDSESHTLVVQDMIRVFESQRLISLQTLFDLADNLERVGSGEKLKPELVNKLAARISEVQLPRSAMSSTEKNALGYGYWTEKHIENQRKLNLRATIERAGNDPEKLKDIRGSLAPFLRDTLVGLNYIHYAPPGAQILHTNPVFVRSHDFIGFMGNNQTWKQTEVFGSGWPANAGGRLVGSLTGLPYALAEAEQNFLIPSREQALIWGDLVPQILISSVIPRWWSATPAQVHWVGLHMALGESMMAESAFDPAVRERFSTSLSRCAAPARAHKVEDLISAGKVMAATDQVMPSELFAVAADAVRAGDQSLLASEIRRLSTDQAAVVNYPAVARLFGTPKPTLSNSYRPELLNLRTFPTLMGYSSRIMAETWESNLLYYAALADEIHAQPSQLNLLIPSWTQQTVEKIFATHLEDWPALLRSLRAVGEDVRQKARKQAAPVAGGE